MAIPVQRNTSGRRVTRGPNATTTDSTARTTATVSPIPSKALPTDDRKWEYQAGSPELMLVSWV